jgi:carbon-monoxide dehydrogenase medium subunit
VRNRGTIGGSLCHADPAADWVTTLLALNAEALTSSRAVPLQDFFTGAFRTCLAQGEILTAVRIPRLGGEQKFGYYKACRKPGEFAHAMAAILQTGAQNRVVIGAMGGIPLVFEDVEAQPETIATALKHRAPALDDVTRHMQLIAVKRAFESLAA